MMEFSFLPRSSSTASSSDTLSTKSGPSPVTPRKEEWNCAPTIHISSAVVNSLPDTTKRKRLPCPPKTSRLRSSQDIEVVNNHLAGALCSKPHFFS